MLFHIDIPKCKKKNEAEEKRCCIFCGRELSGRSDKKFCDDNCRNNHSYKQNKYNNVSILGELAELTLGVEYEITAEEQLNKYGTSYKVINIKRDLPTTTEGTYLFLSEILTENQAKTLISNYPNIIQMVKDNDLSSIDFSKLKGIKEKTFEKKDPADLQHIFSADF